MRALLLIPDGVGVRNFVLGPFLATLARRATPHIVHNIPSELLPRLAPDLNGDLRWHAMEPYRQTRTALLLSYALGYAQMYWADTESMRRLRQQTPGSTLRLRTLVRSSRLLGRASATPRRMQWLDRLHCRHVEQQPEVARYRNFFRQVDPDILFCSHQRPSSVVPAVLAARALGIPTATFIFSWDNITSKGRIVAPFDHYLVWSAHMRDELLRYYPWIPATSIHIVGTPQFDPYADPALLWSRDEFFRRIGADPSRPLICYSAGDAGTCPEDPLHLRIVMQLIRDGRIDRTAQVVARPVPVDDGQRFAAVRRDYPELIFMQPEWIHTEPGNWAQVIPTPSDVRFLANITHHADLNINLGSTMTLDFGLHDKPVVNIAFDVAEPPIFGMPLWDYYYHFEHYRPVVEFGAARFARSADELATHVNAYLADPTLDRDGRRRLAELEVGAPLGTSSELIVETLAGIAARRAAQPVADAVAL